MGYTTEANRALQIQTIVRILDLVKAQAEESPPELGREL